MDPFATVDELAARLDFEMSPKERSMAEGALDDASMLVRAHGKNWPDAVTAPYLAKTITLSAAKRYMANPDGFITSRAGDETVGWDEQGEQAGSVYLTAAEIKLLTRIVRPNGLVSVPVIAYGPTRATEDVPGYVPAEGSINSPFPYFSSETSVW